MRGTPHYHGEGCQLLMPVGVHPFTASPNHNNRKPGMLQDKGSNIQDTMMLSSRNAVSSHFPTRNLSKMLISLTVHYHRPSNELASFPGRSCSMQNRGKAWEIESRAWCQVDMRVDARGVVLISLTVHYHKPTSLVPRPRPAFCH